MDKLPALFGPYQIGMRRRLAHFLLSSVAVRIQKGIVSGSALRQSHVRILRIEQILPALVILDMQGAQRAVQLLRRNSQLLRHLGSSEAGNGIEHVIAIERFRQKITHLILQLDDVITILGDANHLLIHHIIQAADFRILFADELLLLFNLQTLLLQQILLLLERSTEDFFCMSDCLLIALSLLYRDITARLANLRQPSLWAGMISLP